MCGQPDPGYLSTNNHPEDAAPVPVCGVACERRYLRAKGLYAKAPKIKKRKTRSLQKKGRKLQRVPRASGGSSAASAPFGHDLLSICYDANTHSRRGGGRGSGAGRVQGHSACHRSRRPLRMMPPPPKQRVVGKTAQ